MTHPRTPVLIGAGQYTYRGDPLASPPPLASMHVAASAAARDAGLATQALAHVDLVGVVGFTIDSGAGGGRFPRLSNPPRALAEACGARPGRFVYSHMGGNTPQALVNWAAERIANGEADFVLLAGAEFLGGLRKKLAAGADLSAY
ncbi:MAG TPA: acetyl-CoA acetyltransferase, partial [Caulobacterales bacterium]|nr:acetyl-CoA acetyltransferase [Caulobacterales bacterium]